MAGSANALGVSRRRQPELSDADSSDLVDVTLPLALSFCRFVFFLSSSSSLLLSFSLLGLEGIGLLRLPSLFSDMLLAIAGRRGTEYTCCDGIRPDPAIVSLYFFIGALPCLFLVLVPLLRLFLDPQIRSPFLDDLHVARLKV